MFIILKYVVFDLLRSRWSLVYLLFYLLLGFVLLFLNNNLSNAVITLLNIVLVLTPLIGTIFGVMYYYDSKEFAQLILAQPIKASNLFIGQFLGLSLSLSISLTLGLGIPFLFYGLFGSAAIWNFLTLIIVGVILTFIFVGLAFMIAISNENKLKGFGYAILMWLFLAVIYNGIIMIPLVVFTDYPLDKFSLIVSCFNPIDLSRILILLQLDISALMGYTLMGYTGAIFKSFFGTMLGQVVSFTLLGIWVLIP